MFSFIKWLESIFERVRKNKGMMFMTLSIVSVLGILLSLYFVNFMVEDVANKTFNSEKKKFSKELKLFINQEKDSVLSIATLSSMDSELIDIYKSEDQPSQSDDTNDTNQTIPKKTLHQVSKKFSTAINKNLSRNDITINFYKAPKSDGEDVINGLIVSNTGTYFKATLPFATKDDTYLKVDVTSDIDELKKLYEQTDKTFAFLLNDSSMSKLDRTVFKKLYTKIGTNYAIKTSSYSGDILSSLQSLDFSKLLKQGFLRDKDNFYVVNTIHDKDGAEIGIAIIIDKIDDDSIVKLVKSLVNNVTLVALGLIVSMILFLF